MTSEDHFRHLEALYASAPCNQTYDLRMTVSRGRAEVRLGVSEAMHHPGRTVHGANYFKVLDDAAYFAANSLVEDVLVLTASFSLEFLRPVAAGTILSVGQVRKGGKTLIFAESVLTDADGNELAIGRGTFARSKLPIPSVPA